MGLPQSVVSSVVNDLRVGGHTQTEEGKKETRGGYRGEPDSPFPPAYAEDWKDNVYSNGFEGRNICESAVRAEIGCLDVASKTMQRGLKLRVKVKKYIPRKEEALSKCTARQRVKRCKEMLEKYPTSEHW